jgi:hypothetical protein
MEKVSRIARRIGSQGNLSPAGKEVMEHNDFTIFGSRSLFV